VALVKALQLSALASLLAASLLGCPPSAKVPDSDAASDAATTRVVESGPPPKDGKAIYDRYCKLCHGADGVGYAADNANALTNQGFLATVGDAFLYTAIRQGRPGTSMAAYGDEFGGPLDQNRIIALMKYLRAFRTIDKIDVESLVVEGDATRAKKVYAKKCASCHGAKGEGKTALSVNNPLFLATASDGFIRYAIDHGRDDTPMPGFGSKLTKEQIDDLTVLLRSWARTVDDQPRGEKPPPIDRVVINPDGPPANLGSLREGRYVAADTLKKAVDSGARMIVLDARPTSDWLKSHFPGALPVPYYDGIGEIAKALPRDGTWIIAYCGCPHAASGRVMDMLRGEGFKNTAVIDEGILVWTQRGYPMTHGAR
jgi:cytochrome c oxidase cbb3-type subunit 3